MHCIGLSNLNHVVILKRAHVTPSITNVINNNKAKSNICVNANILKTNRVDRQAKLFIF